VADRASMAHPLSLSPNPVEWLSPHQQPTNGYPETRFVGTITSFVGNAPGQPECRPLPPGARHWEILPGVSAANPTPWPMTFRTLYLAALAIEAECDWIPRTLVSPVSAAEMETSLPHPTQ